MTQCGGKVSEVGISGHPLPHSAYAFENAIEADGPRPFPEFPEAGALVDREEQELRSADQISTGTKPTIGLTRLSSELSRLSPMQKKWFSGTT